MLPGSHISDSLLTVMSFSDNVGLISKCNDFTMNDNKKNIFIVSLNVCQHTHETLFTKFVFVKLHERGMLCSMMHACFVSIATTISSCLWKLKLDVNYQVHITATPTHVKPQFCLSDLKIDFQVISM